MNRSRSTQRSWETKIEESEWKKKKKESEWSLRDLYKTVLWVSICFMRLPEGEEREKETKEKLELNDWGIPSLKKDINLQLQWMPSLKK